MPTVRPSVTTVSQVAGLSADLAALVPQTTTVNGHALSTNVTVSKSDVGLGLAENTALSTWPGSVNLTTLGTVTAGTWHGSVLGPAYVGTGTPGAGKYVDGGTGAWTALPSGGGGGSDATLTFSDITTNNVSAGRHGFAPKLPNDATRYLDGTGVYSVPTVGGSSPVIGGAVTGGAAGSALQVDGSGNLSQFPLGLGVVNVLNPPAGLTPAAGDGATDDSAAIQAILDAYPGHTIYLPRKAGPVFNLSGGLLPSYYLASTLTIAAEAHGTKIRGDGLSTLIRCGDSEPGITGFDFYAPDCSVEDLSLEGSEPWGGANSGGWWEGAIPAGFFTLFGVVIPGITVANGASDADGIRFRQAQCSLRNVRCRSFGRDGVNANASLLASPVGWGLESGQLDKLDCTSNRGHGLDIIGGDSNTTVFSDFNGNTNQFFAANLSAFLANVNHGGQVAQNHLDSTYRHPSSPPAAVASLVRSGDVVTLTWVEPQISPNYVTGTHGVQITTCPDASLLGRWPVRSVAGDNLSLTFACKGSDATVSGGVVAETGTLAGGQSKVTGLSSTAGITVGMRAFGSVIPWWATVTSVDSGSQVTLSVQATASGTSTITFSAIGGYLNFLAPETTCSLSRSGGVVTATFPSAYVLNSGRNPLRCGLGITVLNCANFSFDGTFPVVTGASDHLSVTYNQSGPNATTTGYCRMAVPEDTWGATGLLGGSYACSSSACQLVMVGPYAEGGQNSYLSNSTLVLNPTWSDDPTFDGTWSQLPLVIHAAISGLGTPGTNQPLGIRFPYDHATSASIVIGKTAPQAQYEYWRNPVFDYSLLTYPVIWTFSRTATNWEVGHRDPGQVGYASRLRIDLAGGYTYLDSEGGGPVRVNADAGTGTGGLIVGDGGGANNTLLAGPSIALPPVADSAAGNGSVFLSTAHQLGGNPFPAFKSSAGVVTSLAPGGGGGSPGGSSGQLQFNSSSAFAGAAFSAVATSGSLLTLTAPAITDTPLLVKGAAGQTAALFKAQTSDGAGYVSVAADGQTTFWNNTLTTFALVINAANNAGFYLYNNGALKWTFLSNNGTFQVQDNSGNAFNVAQVTHQFLINAPAGSIAAQLGVVSGDPAVPGMVVRATASQAANLVEWQGSAGTPFSTVNENGYFTTRKTAAPADAELANSEAAFWLDDTPGATKFMFKAKDSGGTVRTGSVALT